MAAPCAAQCFYRTGGASLLQRAAQLPSCYRSSSAVHQCPPHRCFFWKKWNSSRSVVRPGVVRPSYAVPKHIQKPDYVSSSKVPEWLDYIEIKDEEQIQGLRRACQLARHVLLLAGKSLKVGMSTDEIDFIVHQEAIRHNAYPSPLHYGGFPKSVCTSVNNVVCHGIPDSKIANSNGFCVCPYFIGHGIGTYFHGYPEIWHHANDIDLQMEEGMSFTIEPILMEGSSEFKILRDKWTAVSVDDKRSAQFEHTVVITSDGVEILTKLPDED
ncbi:methionine aminopeptidase 1D, mitochondrial-like [Sinocyclocheilus grahami]|uniref:methionine aminopeptidase 1D, mitochondrial-like n=1 Tax=Sinocyclocheilus grahami TaxID=75366 RepID=UPI0007ACEB2E|nr:PREDICTED: methionine aminopeptidase 1D, mitochondrial-like [Sinocyclocheilus grahami]